MDTKNTHGPSDSALNRAGETAVASLIVKAGEEIILPARLTGLFTRKADGSYLTAADVATSRLLEAELPKILPGSVVLSEEGEPRAVSEFSPTWIVDPIDGTRPFALGGTLFGTMVALVVGGVVVRAWIYRPLQRSMLFFDGQRTWLDEKECVFHPSGLSFYGTLQCSRFHRTFPPKDYWNVTKHGVANGESFKFAHELIDFFATDRIVLWDLAAPVGVHLGMGGFVAHMDGGSFDLGKNTLPLLFAKNKQQWEELRPLVQKWLTPPVETALP
jgi:fructose-1,6-bisphosphatase/inositol monophosphatase family enzyme